MRLGDHRGRYKETPTTLRARTRRARHLAGAGVALVLAAAIGGAPVSAQSPSAGATEYRVKAAFLYKFAKFVSWPEVSDAAFTLCVIGTDPFGASLDQTVKDKRVGEQPVQIRRLESGSSAAGCRVLFVSSSERPRVAAILGELEGKPTLTVADMDGFATSGGMINFRLEDRRVRLEINPDRAKAANLKIDSALLSLAKVVSDGD